MQLEDALDGFKLALKYSLPEETGKALRSGMEALSDKQRISIQWAVGLFQEWREEQEARINENLCNDCDLEAHENESGGPLTREDAQAIVQCLSCGLYFCDYHWTDHLEMSVEHEVPLGQ